MNCFPEYLIDNTYVIYVGLWSQPGGMEWMMPAHMGRAACFAESMSSHIHLPCLLTCLFEIQNDKKKRKDSGNSECQCQGLESKNLETNSKANISAQMLCGTRAMATQGTVS